MKIFPVDPREPKKPDVRELADLLPTSEAAMAAARDLSYHHLVRHVLQICTRAMMEVRRDLFPDDGWSMPAEYDLAMFYADFPRFPYALDCYRTPLTLPVLPAGMPLAHWRRSPLYKAWHTMFPTKRDDRPEIMCFAVEKSRSVYMCTTIGKASCLPLYICFTDDASRPVYVAEYHVKAMQQLL